MGCLPINVESSLSEQFFHPWETDGGGAWNQWLKSIEEFRMQLSHLFNAKPKEFCPQANVSSAFTKILSSLPTKKDKISLLISEHDFPTISFVAQQCKCPDVNITYIPKNQSMFNLNVWEQYLDKSIDVAFITHVTSDTSQQAPVKDILNITQGHNIVSVVDIAQSAGVLPIDLKDWNADFVIGSCIKWLCGGPGAGFLWINEDNIKSFEPADVGWFSHKNPFEFDMHHFEYADNANRFWGGTPSVIPFVIACESLKTLSSIGFESIANHNALLVDKVLGSQIDQDFEIVTPHERNKRGGSITLRSQNNPKLFGRLKAQQVHFDMRQQNHFRFSPHIYNSHDEIDHFIETVLR